MKAPLLILLALAPWSALAYTYTNDWTPLLVCDNYGMVVDRSSSGDSYQLVIRNHPDTIRYFSSKTDISRAVNDKGEMIVSLSTGGPHREGPSSLYVGYINGQTSVVVSRESDTVIRVGLWNMDFRGTHSEEVANWIFRDCGTR